MTLNTALLMMRLPRLFEPSNLVIQIDDSVVIHALSMHFVELFMKQGYQIAVNEFEFKPRYMSLMDSIQYIKADMRSMTEPVLRNLIDVARGMHKKIIATHIETHKKFVMAQSLMADGYEGPYITTRLQMEPKGKWFLGGEFFRLFYEATRDVPDGGMIEGIIASDPQLSYGLMKLANSQYFAIRKRPSTVKQALSAIGVGQLKKWIFMLMVDPAKPVEGTEEFLRLSFMRAYFYRELMRYSDEVTLSQNEGYLVGMFSALPYLVDMPIGRLLDRLDLSPVFQRTLERQDGSNGMVLQLILAYEIGDWEQVDHCAAALQISAKEVGSAYFASVEAAESLWTKLNTPYKPQM